MVFSLILLHGFPPQNIPGQLCKHPLDPFHILIRYGFIRLMSQLQAAGAI
jgi:hypothetical protein